MGRRPVLGHHIWPLLAALGILLLLSMTLGISLGPAPLPFGRVWGIILHEMFPGWEAVNQPWPGNEVGIVWQIRFPRVLLGAIVGAGLAMTGTVIQALVRNSLADPYLLGISSGACSGAVFVILFGHRVRGEYLSDAVGVSLLAFLGAAFAFWLVFLTARGGRGLTPLRMVLAGLAVSYIFTALTNFMVYMSQHNGAESAMFWMLGGLGGARWGRLGLPFAVTLACFLAFTLCARSLNALLLGEENAVALGVNVTKFRRFFFAATSILTGVIVAVSGSIGFVGLIVPHAARLIAGADHRRVLPVSALAGAVFLVGADAAARTILAPRELPLGIVTGFIGAPFFIWLLKRHKGSV